MEVVKRGGAMSTKKDICVICAYRGTCQKRFSLKAGRHCPEFARDVTIKEESEESEQQPQKK
jgi:hypothetical protein